jgi:Tfp pilus assembly protein PilO
MRLLLPFLLIGAALGLFGLYTNKAYQGPGGIKSLQAQVAAFDEALDKAQELKKRRDELLSKRNTFSAEDIQKLERILPDNVDNIRFIIDINGIAARRNLSLRNVALGTLSDAKSARSALAIGSSGDPVGSAEVSFSVTATYEEFLAFLQDLEHSLRIVDVEKLAFKPNENGRYEFALTIRTYWLH